MHNSATIFVTDSELQLWICYTLPTLFCEVVKHILLMFTTKVYILHLLLLLIIHLDTVTGGAIAGIVIAAVVFVILHLIMIALIVYYKRLHSKNQKFANVVYENNNTSDGDLQAEYHQLERSQSHAQPFDTIRPKDLTYSNNQSNTVSQENERRRFLKRGVRRFFARDCTFGNSS